MTAESQGLRELAEKLEGRGLSARLLTYCGENPGDEPIEDLVVTNPVARERGQVRIGDDGAVTWELFGDLDATGADRILDEVTNALLSTGVRLPQERTNVTEVIAELADIHFSKIARELEVLGYSVLRTACGEDALIATASALGNLIGARSFGVTHLRATGSDVWLGRHTETLTDASEPIRYFALGCLTPATRGGETLLFDGRKAARLLTGTLHGAREIRIRYRSQYRPEIADHSLIVDDEQHGPVLRYRSATENNEVIAKPADINETGLYAAVEDAVTSSLALIHTWHAGELLLVDNHTMLHSRAPFAGLRHMLRFRYDDPLHPTVIIAR
ncbi:MAG TPA: TauD/TfdA family dioxygenase [Streptosporangiaceae bacterium]|nr:TauD/TfdA family dioxygenase [Streptosporangiaceae bacterium]